MTLGGQVACSCVRCYTREKKSISIRQKRGHQAKTSSLFPFLRLRVSFFISFARLHWERINKAAQWAGLAVFSFFALAVLFFLSALSFFCCGVPWCAQVQW